MKEEKRILVDITVPPMERSFDFEVDVSETVLSVKLCVEAIIEDSTGLKFDTSKREMFLFRTAEFMDDDSTLDKQGIADGDRIFLI